MRLPCPGTPPPLRPFHYASGGGGGSSEVGAETDNQRLKKWLAAAIVEKTVPSDWVKPISSADDKVTELTKVTVLSGKGKWHVIDLTVFPEEGSMDEKCQNSILSGLQSRCAAETTAPGCARG